MSRKSAAQTASQGFVEMSESVHRVTGLIRRVLLKFPENTLPQELKTLTWDPNWSFRLSNDRSEVVLTALFTFKGPATARFPRALLGAQDSEITRWARYQYWWGVEEARQQYRHAAHQRVTAAAKAVEHARQELLKAETTLQQLSREDDKAWAPTKKQRRAQLRHEASK